MTLFRFKPTSPGLRGKVKIFNNLYKGKPFKKLCKSINNNSGRNNKGFITINHKGGKHKRYYRLIDFFRNKENISGVVERIEYDPNRNSNLCLILYSDGERRYIISPKNIKIGDIVKSGLDCNIKIGNNLFIKDIPVGTKISCVETTPGGGAKLARAAGCYCVLTLKNLNLAKITMSSGYEREIDIYCKATIGEVGNSEHILINYGKAGSKRFLGIRPTVRGVAMNPIDHPHGGGEGKTSGGRDPVTRYGKLTKSLKKFT